MFDYMFSLKYGSTFDPKIMIHREKIDKFNKMNITGKELYKYEKLFVRKKTLEERALLNKSNYIEGMFKGYKYEKINWDLPHIEYFFKKYCTYALLNNLSMDTIYLLIKGSEFTLKLKYCDKKEIKLAKTIIQLAKKYSRNYFKYESTNNWYW